VLWQVTEDFPGQETIKMLDFSHTLALASQRDAEREEKREMRKCRWTWDTGILLKSLLRATLDGEWAEFWDCLKALAWPPARAAFDADMAMIDEVMPKILKEEDEEDAQREKRKQDWLQRSGK
jgi:hypothetical protein